MFLSPVRKTIIFGSFLEVFRFQSSKTTRQVSEDMALSGESSTVDLASETTKRDNDRGTTEVNMAAVLQGLQTTLAHLAKNSELQTEAIQNLKGEFLLCSGDEDTEDTSAMDDNTSDNALDIAATLNNVLDSSDHSKTASVKSPESGSQSPLVDSLTQAFTTSKVTSPAIEGKIAELIDNMLIGGLSAETVKVRKLQIPGRDNGERRNLGLVAQKKPNCGFGFPAGSGTLVTRNIGPDQIGGQIGETSMMAKRQTPGMC